MLFIYIGATFLAVLLIELFGHYRFQADLALIKAESSDMWWEITHRESLLEELLDQILIEHDPAAMEKLEKIFVFRLFRDGREPSKSHKTRYEQALGAISEQKSFNDAKGKITSLIVWRDQAKGFDQALRGQVKLWFTLATLSPGVCERIEAELEINEAAAIAEADKILKEKHQKALQRLQSNPCKENVLLYEGFVLLVKDALGQSGLRNKVHEVGYPEGWNKLLCEYVRSPTVSQFGPDGFIPDGPSARDLYMLASEAFMASSLTGIKYCLAQHFASRSFRLSPQRLEAFSDFVTSYHADQARQQNSEPQL